MTVGTKAVYCTDQRGQWQLKQHDSGWNDRLLHSSVRPLTANTTWQWVEWQNFYEMFCCWKERIATISIFSDRKYGFMIYCRKLRLTNVGDPPHWPRDTTLSTKVGTKFRRQVAVAQSVSFACGLRARVIQQCRANREESIKQNFPNTKYMCTSEVTIKLQCKKWNVVCISN
jgi:hypothetical protein